MTHILLIRAHHARVQLLLEQSLEHGACAGYAKHLARRACKVDH